MEAQTRWIMGEEVICPYCKKHILPFTVYVKSKRWWHPICWLKKYMPDVARRWETSTGESA